MGDDQNVKGDFKVENYIGIKYDIDGVYGQVSHCKIIDRSEFDVNFGKYITSYKHNNLPDVRFSVFIRNQDNETIFEKRDIEGLPSCLNIDMGTYFRMAQLREMKDNKQSVVIDNFISSDTSLEEVVEKVMQKLYGELMKNGI